MAHEKSLRSILHDDYHLSEKRIDSLFSTTRQLDTKYQRASFIKDFCVRVINKHIDTAAQDLKERIIDKNTLKKAVAELKLLVGSTQGIVHETGTLNKMKLLLYAPDNLQDALLEQMSEIYCPVCYEYYQSEVTDGTVQKINLACHPTHALCAQDIGLVYTKERCLVCKKAVNMAAIQAQVTPYTENDQKKRHYQN